jgi:hypothetical protein
MERRSFFGALAAGIAAAMAKPIDATEPAHEAPPRFDFSGNQLTTYVGTMKLHPGVKLTGPISIPAGVRVEVAG